MRDRIFSDFIVKKNLSNNLNEEELEAIQSGEMGMMLKAFYSITDPMEHVLIESVMKGMEKSFNSVSLEDIVKSREFESVNTLISCVQGQRTIVIGICCDEVGIEAAKADCVYEDENERAAVIRTLLGRISDIVVEMSLERLNEQMSVVKTDMMINHCKSVANKGFLILSFKIKGKELKVPVILDGICINEEIEQ